MFDATFQATENLSSTQSNSESMVALATSPLDKNKFIHFFLGLMILKTYLSIVVVVPLHLDGESWLPLTPWERKYLIKMFNPFTPRVFPIDE